MGAELCDIWCREVQSRCWHLSALSTSWGAKGELHLVPHLPMAKWVMLVLSVPPCSSGILMEEQAAAGHMTLSCRPLSQALLPLTSADTGFPGGSGGKEPSCQCRRHKRCGFDLWVGKNPREGHSNPPQYSRLENAMDCSLVGYSPWGCKELDMTEAT